MVHYTSGNQTMKQYEIKNFTKAPAEIIFSPMFLIFNLISIGEFLQKFDMAVPRWPPISKSVTFCNYLG